LPSLHDQALDGFQFIAGAGDRRRLDGLGVELALIEGDGRTLVAVLDRVEVADNVVVFGDAARYEHGGRQNHTHANLPHRVLSFVECLANALDWWHAQDR